MKANQAILRETSTYRSALCVTAAMVLGFSACSDDAPTSPPPPPDLAPADTTFDVPEGVVDINLKGDVVVRVRSSALSSGTRFELAVADDTDEPLASSNALRSDVVSVSFPASGIASNPGSLLDSVLTVTLPLAELDLTGPAAAVAALTLIDGSRVSTYTRITPDLVEVEVPLRPAIMVESIDLQLPSELSWEVFAIETENPWQASSGPLDGIGLSTSALDPWYLYEITDRHMSMTERTSAYLTNKIPVVLVHGWSFGFDPWEEHGGFDPRDKVSDYWRDFAEAFFDEGGGYWPDYFDLFAFRYDEDQRVTYSGQLLRDAVGLVFPDTPVIVVAHSMGGLVARHALVDRHGDQRIHALITLATPHHGSPLAQIPGALFYPMGSSVLDFLPDGELAGDLNLNSVLSEMNAADEFADRYVVYRDLLGTSPLHNLKYRVGNELLRRYYAQMFAFDEVGSDGVVPHGSAEFKGIGHFRGTEFSEGGDHSSVKSDDHNETISEGVLQDLLSLSYPLIPTSPEPADGEIVGEASIQLSWANCDRFGGSGVRYDLYFGLSADPPLLARVTERKYQMPLAENTRHYWRVVATNSEADHIVGPLWSFTKVTFPIATITTPDDGEVFEEGVPIQFTGSATDSEDGQLTGDDLVWTSSLDGQIGTGQSFTRSDLRVGQHTITLTATDSEYLTNTDEVAITVDDNDPPYTRITAPDDGEVFEEGVPIQFTGSATDPEDGQLTGDDLVWTSSLDGQIGTGQSFTRSDLRVGQHTITLTATDSAYLTDTDEVTIRVYFDGPPPPPPTFVSVPSGTFVMGDGVANCGEAERQVTLSRDFWLGQYEVTNQEYLELVQWAYDRGYVTATSSSVRDNLNGGTRELVDLDEGRCELAFSGGVFSLRNAGHGINPDHPMKRVSWYGAARYCDWLSLSEGLRRAYESWICGGGDPYSAEGYRLPTDAEWEYAAQWDDERIYPWGDTSPQECVHANYDRCVGWTSPVGSYPSGVQPNLSDPIYDLAGNVREWANDWFECDLGTSPDEDPAGPDSGYSCVLRGGNWLLGASHLRVATRYPGGRHFTDDGIGFRIARTAP